MKIRYGEHGIHVFNRLTGANLLIDEVTVPKELWSIAPRHVSIALTNTCDLACSYCYAPKKKSQLKMETIIGWLHELDANGTLGVGFGGGEPTLYPQFAELCEYTTANTRLAVSFTTHGHHLQDKLLAKLKGNIHFVRVSVDGLGTTYERLRKRSFSTIKERIAALRHISPFGINYVVNNDTIDDLENAIDFANDLGASDLLLLPEHDSRSPNIQRVVVEKLTSMLQNYKKALPLSISQHSSTGMPICNPFEGENRLLSYAHVDAEGMLKETSYEKNGSQICIDGFMKALHLLIEQQENNYF